MQVPESESWSGGAQEEQASNWEHAPQAELQATHWSPEGKEPDGHCAAQAWEEARKREPSSQLRQSVGSGPEQVAQLEWQRVHSLLRLKNPEGHCETQAAAARASSLEQEVQRVGESAQLAQVGWHS